MRDMKMVQRRATREVRIGSIAIGNDHPIAVQTMTSTHTYDGEATLAQVYLFEEAGADIVRIAVDSRRDIEGLAMIRDKTRLNLSADLQENYKVANEAATYVDKIRYNPGHLYHLEREKPWQDKVKYIAEAAVKHDCALRIGVNCGSVDPALKEKYPPQDSLSPMIESALHHCELLNNLGFYRYCVSLKDSDPYKVVELNRRFSEQRPEIPLHLGVTEAGMLPDALIKTRIALEQLISKGIGDTIRVSLTLSSSQKAQEIHFGRKIVEDIAAGRVISAVDYGLAGLHLISCPSCSRVENEEYVKLADEVRIASAYAKKYKITVAVMGCRVNGPGETDHADLGLWCGPKRVNLKRGSALVGSFLYDEIIMRFKEELDKLVEERSAEI